MSNTQHPSDPTSKANREIKLISHSNLFYWWPVWFFAFVFAIWTGVEGNRLAIVPHTADVKVTQTAQNTRYELDYTTPKKYVPDAETASETAKAEKVYKARVSDKAWLGSLFVLILVLTVVITNVPLRGLWSFMVIVLVVVIALLITLFHAWDDIFSLIGGLHIYINMAGYLFIGGAILLVWAVATYIFDRRAYIIFTPGQVKVCDHIGAAVRTFDTVGMTFEKQRDDLFRHYILGFGSGDLIVRTSGAERQEIKIHNVLGIGWKLKQVEDVIREKSMVM
jgi:cation transport ATPase